MKIAANQSSASVALVLGGMLWGVYWIPVRYFIDLGFKGPWPGIVMFILAALALVPFAYARRAEIKANWRVLAVSGLFTGAAFSLYSTSLFYTDVVRAILLFYLTPIWSTFLGMAFLGERPGRNRIIGLLCGIAGLLVVLGVENAIPWPRNIGDWLALLSGMTWALGSLGLYKAESTSVTGQITSFVFGALLVSSLSLVALSDPLPDVVWSKAAPAAIFSVLYVLPMVFLTIWPATLLTPARVGLLLMSEVVVGIISAALLAQEVFGMREAIGAALIVSAALFEVAGPTHTKQA